MEPPAKRSKVDNTSSSTRSWGANASVAGNVGIDEFMDPSSLGFSCTIKSRYSDFQVCEIDQDKVVVELTDTTTIPQGSNDNVSTESAWKELQECVGKETLTKIRELMENQGDSILTQEFTDKDLRTRIHQLIRTASGGKLDSKTTNGAVEVMKKSASTNAQRDQTDWKALGGDYCQFVLYKENKDTHEALNILSKVTGFSFKLFSMAGTKDKRAVTTQWVTCFKVKADNLAKHNQRLRGLQIGNYKYVPKALQLGDLWGNRFTIVMRDVQGATQDEIEKSLKVVQDKGFINYYGLQRFGTSSLGTHEVGRFVLRLDWKGAIHCLLSPQSNDTPEQAAAKKQWLEDGDAKRALKGFKHHFVAERSVLEYLSRNPQTNDWKAAFYSIPRNLRTMYCHAWQSYVWNKAVSRRLKMGRTVQIGDLVIDDKDWHAPKEDGGKSLQRAEKVKVIATEEEANTTSPDLVVLPLPGPSIQFPQGEIGNAYQEILDAEDIKMDNLNALAKDFALHGSFRRIFARASGLKWQFSHFEKDDDTIACTALEKLQGKQSVSQGNRLALTLEFNLESASYATMLIREVTKKLDVQSGLE